MRKKNGKIKVVIGLIIIFILWNIVWGYNYSLYNEVVSLDYEIYVKCYGKNYEGYDYSIKKPDYFSLKGNFAITNKSDTISIVIWPDIFMRGGYDYGLSIFDEGKDQGYLLYVDQDLNYMEISKNKFDSIERKNIDELLDMKSHELNAMLELARKEWDLY